MKKLLLLMVVLTTSLSCKKFLTERPEDFLSPENYYETEAQLDFALNGVYTVMTENGTYASAMLGRLGLEADEGYNNNATDNASVSDYAVFSSDAKIQLYWTVLYKGIDRANRLLENLHKPAMNETKRDRIKGQALFLRSYYYLMLVTRFGDVPLLLKSAADGSPESVQVPKTAAKEIYNQILADMEEASGLVADITAVESAGRVSKSAVWGIMARVCLYMAGNPINDVAKYQEAIMWANKVISLNYHQLNSSYQQVFINYAQDKYDLKESIWEVEFWGNGIGVYTGSAGAVGMINGIGGTADDNIGRATGVLFTTKWHLQVYEAGDLRRDWTIAPFRYEGNPPVESNWSASVNQIYTRYCGKWRRKYELVTPKGNRTPQNFPLLRYSDVLLMLAEAENEVNKTPTEAAYTAINQVRRRGFGKPINTPDPTLDIQNQDYETFKLTIRNERAKELGFEGLRKNDLVRWGIFYDRMKVIYADVEPGNNAAIRAAKKYYGNVTQRDVVWPIPSYELGINKKLEQHDLWK